MVPGASVSSILSIAAPHESAVCTPREDIGHVSRVYHLLEQQQKHLVLLNKFGSSSKNLAVLAAVMANTHVHLIDDDMKEADYREILLNLYCKVLGCVHDLLDK